MPNHIQSRVEITGTKEAIDKLVKESGLIRDARVEENKFDFNAVVKTPDDIFQGNLGQEERKKYGNRNWYDWNYENWGTKWNAYDTRYFGGDDTTLVFEITTAWGTPWPIWQELERQGLTVKGVYFGEMEGYDWIGDGQEAFDAYAEVEIEYTGGAISE